MTTNNQQPPTDPAQDGAAGRDADVIAAWFAAVEADRPKPRGQSSHGSRADAAANLLHVARSTNIGEIAQRALTERDAALERVKSHLVQTIDVWVENGTCDRKNGYQMAVRFRDVIEEAIPKPQDTTEKQ